MLLPSLRDHFTKGSSGVPGILGEPQQQPAISLHMLGLQVHHRGRGEGAIKSKRNPGKGRQVERTNAKDREDSESGGGPVGHMMGHNATMLPSHATQQLPGATLAGPCVKDISGQGAKNNGTQPGTQTASSVEAILSPPCSETTWGFGFSSMHESFG